MSNQSATNLTQSTTSAKALSREAVACCLAAEAVQATLSRRAPARVLGVSLEGGVEYALAPDPAMLQVNRGLLEDLVTVYLAPVVAAHLQGVQADLTAEAEALTLLQSGLTEPEELAASLSYMDVLRARCAVSLRRSWTEVQVVAAGLLDCGELSAEALGHRIGCAQHLRGKTLN